MKSIAKCIGIAAWFWTFGVSAQITPDIDHKGVDSGVSYTVPKALSGFNFNFSDPKLAASFNLNMQPVFELVGLLENRGAKITPKLLEGKNMVLMELEVDGKPLSPIVVQCLGCIIIYEY